MSNVRMLEELLSALGAEAGKLPCEFALPEEIIFGRDVRAGVELPPPPLDSMAAYIGKLKKKKGI